MKIAYATLALTVFALAFSPSGEAQVWHPMPHAYQADRYDYMLDQDSVPNYPLRADSLSFAGTDTIWHIRPYPAACDTCGDVVEECPSRYYPGIPLFMGSTLRNLGGGEFHAESPSDTLILQTQIPLGIAWTFNETGLVATIDSVYEMSLWGSTTDSVKRIVVGSTDTILLSKRHGLLRFPSAFGVGDTAPYILSGIAGRNLGWYIPDWKAMFDIEIGTELQYDIRSSGNSSGSESTFRGLVTAIASMPDSIVITLEGSIKTRHHTSIFGGTFGTYHCRIKIEMIATPNQLWFRPITPYFYLCGFPQRSIESNFNRDPMEWGFSPAWQGDPLYGGLDQVVNYIPGRLTRINRMVSSPVNFGVSEWFSGCTNFVIPPPIVSDDPVVVSRNSDSDSYGLQGYATTQNLGLIRSDISAIDFSSKIDLTAYRIGTETWGVFEDTTAWPIGLSAEGLPETFSAFPNPSNGTLYIKGWSQTAQATVTDATGRIVLEQTFQEGHALDLHALPNGLYWIELRNKERRGLATISLQRP